MSKIPKIKDKLFATAVNLKVQLMIILFSLAFFQGMANGNLEQKTKITLDFESTALDQVLTYIEKSTSYKFLFQNKEVNVDERVTIKADNEFLEVVLNRLFKNTKITYEFFNDQIILKLNDDKNSVEPDKIMQQSFAGKVFDKNDFPLPGVSVIIKGTQRGTTTDIDGNFVISASKGDVLMFIHIGFFNKEVELIDDTVALEIQLDDNISNLDEVVITGYQKIDINKTTGATKGVLGSVIERKGNSNVLQSLEGQVAGLSIQPDPREEGNTLFNIRGITTLQANATPLIVVDGFPIEADLSTINPYEIESVTVLKDAAANSIYGARAANGVIVIVTKKGKLGSVNVSYSSNVTMTSKPDLEYRLNRVSSSDLVDIHKQTAQRYFDQGRRPYEIEFGTTGARNAEARSLAIDIWMKALSGLTTISDAEQQLNSLRSIDNTKQLSDFYLRSELETQHNLSLSGGEEKNRYRASINYTTNSFEWAGSESNRLIVDLNNSFKLSPKVSVDLAANATFNNREEVNIDQNLILNANSYENIFDDNGNPKSIRVGSLSSGFGRFGGKDPFEIQRLIDAGLLDETYVPVDEFGRDVTEDKDISIRLQAALNYQILPSLKGELSFQYESGSSKNTNKLTENAYEMRELINNSTPLTFTGLDSELNIPIDGRIIETRGDRNSYTFRAQLNFDKQINVNNIVATLGTELRNVFSTSTTINLLGYNDRSLTATTLNYFDLTNLQNTYHPTGRSRVLSENSFNELQNRFFSLYGNVAYTFKERYVLTGSIRVDQSNLFGTDPKYRWKPFWSGGFKWRVAEESYFNSETINNLDLRFTYGINGNIANDVGPFDIGRFITIRRPNGEILNSIDITSFAVNDLRWERTRTINYGLDLGLFKNRISLSIDLYNKETTDLLGTDQINPTLGTDITTRNVANLSNKGAEFSLNTINLVNNNFNWSSFLTFSLNKNKVTKVFDSRATGAPIMQAGFLKTVENQPLGLFRLLDYAGVDADGNGVIRLSDGSELSLTNDVDILNDFVLEDLLFSGTIYPKYTGAITNTFEYKNFKFSFMFVGSGGHKLLADSYNGDIVSLRPESINADAANAWKNPGDELSTNIPILNWNRINGGNLLGIQSNKNLIDGDYIKLREVILSYQLPNTIFNNTFKGVSFSMRANNLFYWAKNDVGIDPESHGVLDRFFPTKTSYTLGVKLDF